MKYTQKLLLALLFVSITMFLTGCTAVKDVASMTATERYDYAKSLYDNEDYYDAVKEFESLLLQYPASEIADDAQYYLGMTRYNRGEYLIAAFEFSKLIRNMTGSDYVKEAQYMISDSYYKLSPHYALDQQYTLKAIEEFQAFIDFSPTDPKVAEAEAKIKELNKKIAYKDFASAEIYEKMGYTLAALDYYKNVIDRYHDTEYAPESHYRRVQILLDKNRLSEALKDVNSYLSRYPEAPRVSEMQQLKTQIESGLAKN